MNSIYQENGYKNRQDYLEYLSEETGVDLEVVEYLADLFGPSEDFDALVTAIEDHSDYF